MKHKDIAGKLLYEGEVLNNEKNGKWIFYNEDSICKVNYYLCGKKIGVWNEKYSNTLIERKYNEGELEYILTTYLDKGYKFKINIKDNSEVFYDLDGNIIEVKRN
ncbi:MAG: hypothetical protein WCK02_09835 [Bacteroidota bacterium]